MLETLTKISNKYGADSEMVLAGGGNTSCKDSRYLYVKGSGTALATIAKEDFVKMDRELLAAIWEKQYPRDPDEREAAVLSDLMAARGRGETGRPSVETPLHDLLPYTYVVHLHPALVNGLTCGKNGEVEARRMFPDAVWIGDSNPGFVLALTVREELLRYKAAKGSDAQIIFLKNHGVFVAADSPEEIDAICERIISTLKAKLVREYDFSEVEFDRKRAAAIAPAIRMLLMEGKTSVVTFCTNKDILDAVQNRESFAALTMPFTPDHIVYCKANPLYISFDENIEKQYEILASGIEDYKRVHGHNPLIIAVQNLGFFAWGPSFKNADVSRKLFQDAVKISVYSNSFGGYSHMPSELVDFIVSWEVESYRAKASSFEQQRRAAEKIMVVTGGAQGIGRGIAEEMLEAGANLVIVDLNRDTAAKTARELSKEHGGRVSHEEADVTCEESAEKMITNTVLKYGGIDVLINNAGIVRAGSLEEMTPESLELVSRVNYTAYFICAKYASRIMKIQNRFKTDYFMDIIQINSKSGLAGSNKNFAYAGSKFGGIGLTQSFALELVECGIKVNSICPGNFLDGPLWSDPENGLFVQYLKAGKVPGAKTTEDVKRAYEAKVPMNRGCRAVDVARAVLYCMEQQYETGQAIPVTGGQNMLK